MPEMFSPETRKANKALHDAAFKAAGTDVRRYALALADGRDELMRADPDLALRVRGYSAYTRALGQTGNVPYAVWVTATDWSHPNPNKAKRLGLTRLQQVLPESVRAALVVNQGAAAFIRVMSKNGTPTIAIRARYGEDLALVCRALANRLKAEGITLNVHTATKPAQKVIEGGI